MKTTTRTAVSVDQLRRAWLAVQDGQFRAYPTPDRTPAPGQDLHEPSWAATGQVITVVGATGSCGASTTALALATAAGAARLIECASITASGLSAAATAELGCQHSGWLQGRRDDVLIERCADVLVGPHEVPLPAGTDLPVTVLDAGWELGQILACRGWLAEHLLAAPTVIVVAPASVPGRRRLEGALALLTHTRVVAAVIGPGRRRWAREVTQALGPLTAAIDARGDLLEVPYAPDLAVRGMDSTPLPAPLLGSAAQLLTHTVPSANQKGTAG